MFTLFHRFYSLWKIWFLSFVLESVYWSFYFSINLFQLIAGCLNSGTLEITNSLLLVRSSKCIGSPSLAWSKWRFMIALDWKIQNLKPAELYGNAWPISQSLSKTSNWYLARIIVLQRSIGIARFIPSTNRFFMLKETAFIRFEAVQSTWKATKDILCNGGSFTCNLSVCFFRVFCRR